MIQRSFEASLHKLDADHLRRTLHLVKTACGPVMNYDGRMVVQFASNDYLGLANHPAVKQAACAAIADYGVGAGASRLISGSLLPHHELEAALADFKGTEAGLVWTSGYVANLGLIPALVDSRGLILADRLSHASLIDGCRLSRAQLRVFHHNDPEHVRRLLRKRRPSQPALIVTEGVFSMDGDLAPLGELTALAQEYGALLFVDDAHGTGVMGAHGRGTAEHWGVDPGLLIQMGTLSKALGSVGGYTVGSRTYIEYLVNVCRSVMYSTAPLPAASAAARAALQLVREDRERRIRLWRNREILYQGVKQLGFEVTATQSPILPILLREPGLAVEMSRLLLERGIYIPAIRPPTVPKGTSRLRLTVTSEHTPEHLRAALEALAHIGRAMNMLS
ncbi:MAG: 8-amino-7-oxononanoate synthase [Nitrospirae bacterium]|nr:MAG: 8-amino-7-oxononanoate synthase [Nitrospirota bacterium]